MIKRKDFDKMSPLEQQIFLELLNDGYVKLTKPKSQQKSISELPLFAPKEAQIDLFKQGDILE